MAYKQKKYVFKNAIEIEEYHSGKYGAPGQTRLKRKKPTPEQIEYINQWNKEKRCRRKMRAHFDVYDLYSTLTYRVDERPADMKEAKRHFAEFIREVRREYRKRGYELKWIRNIEVGTKNGWHVHLVINRIPDADIIMQKAWQHGKVISQGLYEQGEFRDLAAYMTKTPKTDSRLKESSYSTSRNLPIPEPEIKIIKRLKTWRADPKEVPGFYLDKETLIEGINPVTGYKYRTYTLLRTQRE